MCGRSSQSEQAMYHGCRGYVAGEQCSVGLLGTGMVELEGDHLSFVIASHDGILRSVAGSSSVRFWRVADCRRRGIHVTALIIVILQHYPLRIRSHQSLCTIYWLWFRFLDPNAIMSSASQPSQRPPSCFFLCFSSTVRLEILG